jgi:hypothetical protein
MLKIVKPLRLFVIPGIFFFFLMILLPHEKAEAATLCHVHTDACYGQVTKTCDSHRLWNEYGIDSFHCNNCGVFRDFHISLWWDVCENGLIENRETGRYESCNTCGYVRKDDNSWVETHSHTYTTKGLICGKDTTTPVASLSLSVSTSSPTNGTVTISANVSSLDSSFQASATPLDFGNGFGSATSMEVSENGTYTVTLTDANGNTISDSITISCIDKTAPTISSLSKSTEEWIEEGLTVTCVAEDESGLAKEAYSFNGGAYSSTNSWFVKSNGTYTVSVKDAAGNVTSKTITIGNIGRDPAVVAAEKAAAEKAAAEKAAAEKAAAEKAAAEKAAADKATAEKAAADKAAAEKAAAAKASTSESSSKSSAASGTASQTGKSSGTSNTAKTGIGKSTSNSGASGKTGTSGKNGTEESVSLNDLSANDKKSDVSGNTIFSKDLTGSGTNGNGTGNGSDTETIETISDLDSLSGDLSAESTEETPAWNFASVNPLTVGLGLMLVFGGSAIASFFNYVYISENGRKKIMTLCRVRQSEKNVRVIVPKGKLKKHGRYMIYFSLWNRIRIKKKPVTVEVEGNETPIDTDDRIAFKC